MVQGENESRAARSTRLWPKLAAQYPSTIAWLNNESPEKIAEARTRDYAKNKRDKTL